MPIIDFIKSYTNEKLGIDAETKKIDASLKELSRDKPDYGLLLERILQKAGDALDCDLTCLSREVKSRGQYAAFFSQDFSKYEKGYWDEEDKDFQVGDYVKTIKTHYPDRYLHGTQIYMMPVGTEGRVVEIKDPKTKLVVHKEGLIFCAAHPSEIAKKKEGILCIARHAGNATIGSEIEVIKESGGIQPKSRGKIIREDANSFLVEFYKLNTQFEGSKILYVDKSAVGLLRKNEGITRERLKDALTAERIEAEKNMAADFSERLDTEVKKGVASLSQLCNETKARLIMNSLLEQYGLYDPAENREDKD